MISHCFILCVWFIVPILLCEQWNDAVVPKKEEENMRGIAFGWNGGKWKPFKEAQEEPELGDN